MKLHERCFRTNVSFVILRASPATALPIKTVFHVQKTKQLLASHVFNAIIVVLVAMGLSIATAYLVYQVEL